MKKVPVHVLLFLPYFKRRAHLFPRSITGPPAWARRRESAERKLVQKRLETGSKELVVAP